MPELAARAHLAAIRPVVREAFDGAGMDWPEIDAIAVTIGQG